jgi:hypothetical protein
MYNEIHEQPEVPATILGEEWESALCGVAFIETWF